MSLMKSKTYLYIELVVLVALVPTYGWATYQRNLVWKDDLSLWSYILA
jgi:hypothetical protein